MESPVPELYDLSRDFDEKDNLAGKADLGPYRKKLAEMEKNLSSPQSEKTKQAVDRTALEKLRSLGYVVSPVTRLKTRYGPEDDLKNFLPFQKKLEAAIIKGDLGKIDESLPLLESLIEERGDFVPAYTYLSQYYAVLGRREDALRVLEQGCRKNPDDYSLLSGYGTALLQTYRYDAAAEVLEKALAIVDFDPEVWNNLGFISWRKGDYPKALEYYRRALALDKTFAPALANLGMLHLSLYGENEQRENLDISIENFEKAATFDPGLNLAFRGLGVALRAARRTDEAIAAWEKAVSIYPEDGYAVVFLAEAYLEKGQKDRALKHLEKYLELKGERLAAEEKEKIQELIRRCKIFSPHFQ
jgi:tetratricopeptide (TPR) repeat protein